MGFDTGVSDQALAQLSQISHALDERLNRSPDKGAPYVGERAFSHKGGLHVSAVEKDQRAMNTCLQSLLVTDGMLWSRTNPVNPTS